MLALGFALLGASGASADTRSLKLWNMHTQEKAVIVFKRNGRFDSGGLRQLNQFLRDWRRDEPTKMDPRLFDLIWEAYTSGSNDYIHVVCGYRCRRPIPCCTGTQSQKPTWAGRWFIGRG